jgi:hypothetical protein
MGRGAATRRCSDGSFVAICFADPLLISSLTAKAPGGETAAVAQTQKASAPDRKMALLRDLVSISGRTRVFLSLLQNFSEITLDGLYFNPFAPRRTGT